MAEKEFFVSKKDGIATVTIDRPPVNVLTIALMEALTVELKEIEKDNEIKVVVIVGGGNKAFSAGVDVADHTAEKMGLMLSSFGELVRTLLKYDKPSIASVNGMALGGGLELMMACDMVIASEKSTFGQPEIKIGVYAPIANVLLPRMIGWKNAMEILLTGDSVAADEAKNMGLVNKVVSEDKLAEETELFAKRLSSKSSEVLKWTRRSIVEALDMAWEKGLEHTDSLYLEKLMKTEDAAEGINAFMEKRKPQFKNK